MQSSSQLPAFTNVGPGQTASCNIPADGVVYESFLLQFIKTADSTNVNEAWIKTNIEEINLTATPARGGSPIKIIDRITGAEWVELIQKYQQKSVQDGILAIDFKRTNQMLSAGQDALLVATGGLNSLILELKLKAGSDNVRIIGDAMHRGYDNLQSFYSYIDNTARFYPVYEKNNIGTLPQGKFTNTSISTGAGRGKLLVSHIACNDKLLNLKVKRNHTEVLNISSPLILKQFTETTGTRTAQAGYAHIDFEGLNNRAGESLDLETASEIRLEGELSAIVNNFSFLTIRAVKAA